LLDGVACAISMAEA